MTRQTWNITRTQRITAGTDGIAATWGTLSFADDAVVAALRDAAVTGNIYPTYCSLTSLSNSDGRISFYLAPTPGEFGSDSGQHLSAAFEAGGSLEWTVGGNTFRLNLPTDVASVDTSEPYFWTLNAAAIRRLRTFLTAIRANQSGTFTIDDRAVTGQISNKISTLAETATHRFTATGTTAGQPVTWRVNSGGGRIDEDGTYHPANVEADTPVEIALLVGGSEVDTDTFTVTVVHGPVPGVTQYAYMRAAAMPSLPAPANQRATAAVPAGWSAELLAATTTQHVYRLSRSTTTIAGVFQSAQTDWAFDPGVQPWARARLVETTEYAYFAAAELPDLPTSQLQDLPTGWQAANPGATTATGVYRIRRVVSRRLGVFISATAWAWSPAQAEQPFEERLTATRTQYAFRRAAELAVGDLPAGTAEAIPQDWSLIAPDPTFDEAVYRIGRQLTQRGDAFVSAEAWVWDPAFESQPYIGQESDKTKRVVTRVRHVPSGAVASVIWALAADVRDGADGIDRFLLTLYQKRGRSAANPPRPASARWDHDGSPELAGAGLEGRLTNTGGWSRGFPDYDPDTEVVLCIQATGTSADTIPGGWSEVRVCESPGGITTVYVVSVDEPAALVDGPLKVPAGTHASPPAGAPLWQNTGIRNANSNNWQWDGWRRASGEDGKPGRAGFGERFNYHGRVPDIAMSSQDPPDVGRTQLVPAPPDAAFASSTAELAWSHFLALTRIRLTTIDDDGVQRRPYYEHILQIGDLLTLFVDKPTGRAGASQTIQQWVDYVITGRRFDGIPNDDRTVDDYVEFDLRYLEDSEIDNPPAIQRQAQIDMLFSRGQPPLAVSNDGPAVWTDGVPDRSQTVRTEWRRGEILEAFVAVEFGKPNKTTNRILIERTTISDPGRVTRVGQVSSYADAGVRAVTYKYAELQSTLQALSVVGGDGETGTSGSGTDRVYRVANAKPSTPTGGTTVESHVPSGWSRTKGDATLTDRVWVSERQRTYGSDDTFTSATAWGEPFIDTFRQPPATTVALEYDDIRPPQPRVNGQYSFYRTLVYPVGHAQAGESYSVAFDNPTWAQIRGEAEGLSFALRDRNGVSVSSEHGDIDEGDTLVWYVAADWWAAWRIDAARLSGDSLRCNLGLSDNPAGTNAADLLGFEDSGAVTAGPGDRRVELRFAHPSGPSPSGTSVMYTDSSVARRDQQGGLSVFDIDSAAPLNLPSAWHGAGNPQLTGLRLQLLNAHFVRIELKITASTSLAAGTYRLTVDPPGDSVSTDMIWAAPLAAGSIVTGLPAYASLLPLMQRLADGQSATVTIQKTA